MDWAEETPGLGKEFSDRGGLHLNEVGSSMNGLQMGPESLNI
jgi:hypothetical protein